MNKSKLSIICISITAVIIAFVAILTSTYFININEMNKISYNRNPLENLLKYKDISGDIVGLSPIDININNLFINNDSLTTTSFHQADPSKNFKVKIISSGSNNYEIYQYLNNKNTGLYKVTLNGSNLNGTFIDYSNNKTYEFKSILTNYTNAFELDQSDTTHRHIMENIFLNYPIYKGKFIFEAIKEPNENITIEYNSFTNQIIQYIDKNPNVIVKLKLVSPKYGSGITLDAYYKNKYAGYMTLYYLNSQTNGGNSEWTGTFNETLNNKNYIYPFTISGSY